MRAQLSTKGVVAITLGAVLLVTPPGQAQGPVLTLAQSLARGILPN